MTTLTVCLMCNAKIIIDTFKHLINLLVPSLENILSHHSPTFFTHTNLDSHDLATFITGSQVHEKSDTIE